MKKILKSFSKKLSLWIDKNMGALLISHTVWAFTCSLLFTFHYNAMPQHLWTLQQYFIILLVGLIVIMPPSFFTAQRWINDSRLYHQGVDMQRHFTDISMSQFIWFIIIAIVALFSLIIAGQTAVPIILGFFASQLFFVIVTIFVDI